MGESLRIFLGIAFLLTFSHPSLAVPENAFEQEFAGRIWPAYEQNGQSAFFSAVDGLKIHYRSFVKPGQDRALLLLPGRSEAAFKFAEVVYDLSDLNLAIYVLDHRGQGASGRETSQSQLQYVRNFHDYKSDLDQFQREVLGPLGYKQTYVLAHSMGSNILAHHMIEHPASFNKVIMSSPLMEIRTDPFPNAWLAKLFASIFCWLGFADTYGFGQGPFDPNENYRGTSSEVRFQAFHALRKKYTEQQVGGLSWGFARAVLGAVEHVQSQAAQLLDPILMLQAGKDIVVKSGGQDEVCRKAKQCKKIHFPEAQHELYLEADGIRDAWLHEIRTFLAAP